MKRKVTEHLLAWKRQPKRKPLILMGARQVGKTFVLKQFGDQEYATTVYLNFEENPRLCKLFDASLDPEMILKALTSDKLCQACKSRHLNKSSTG